MSQSRTASSAATDTEEKYKQVMLTNAQLDNDKQKLMYEVDLLKDSLADTEEHTVQLEHLLTVTSRVWHTGIGFVID